MSSRFGIDIVKEKKFLIPFSDNPIPVDLDDIKEVNFDLNLLDQKPELNNFYSLPKEALKEKNYNIWQKKFLNWIVRVEKIYIQKNSILKIISKQDESEKDFKIRTDVIIREYREKEKEKIGRKYENKVNKLEDKIQNSKYLLKQTSQRNQQQDLENVVSIGTSLIGAFMGKSIRRSRSGRRRRNTRINKIREDRLKDKIYKLQKRRLDLEDLFKYDVQKIEEKINKIRESYENIPIKLKKIQYNN
ncbi:MAG: hypothetical protein ACPKQO_03325 [Nitrososphaeraceae archaeon]